MRSIHSFHHVFSQQASTQREAQSECVFLYDDKKKLLNQKNLADAFPQANADLTRIDQALARLGFKGKNGQIRSFDTQLLGLDMPNIVCLGLGTLQEQDELPSVQQAGVALAKHLRGAHTKHLLIAWPDVWKKSNRRHALNLLTGLNIGLYQFAHYKQKKTPCALDTIEHLGADNTFADAVRAHVSTDEGQNFAKNLMHEPANVLTPHHFAGILNTLTDHGIEVNVLDLGGIHRTS